MPYVVAFWNQVTHLRLEQQPGETLFQRVKRLLHACCRHMSQEEVWEVLSLRCPQPDGISDFLASEEAEELLADRELSEDIKKVGEEGEKAEGQIYRKDYIAARPKIRAQAKAEPQAQRPADKRRRTTPTAPTMTEVEVQAMLPADGSRVWRDERNQRWQLSYRGHRLASRSFALYGYGESAKLIAKIAWEHHALRGGPPPKDAVVREFIGLSARAPAKAGSHAASSSSRR